MKWILIVLIVLSFISCESKRTNRIDDISNEEFIRMSESVSQSYYIILNESEKKGNHWAYQIENAKELDSTVLQILNDIESEILIDTDYINSLKYNEELLDYLPSNFNTLPRNYKKLVIINFEQKQLNEIVSSCLFSSFHYFSVKADIQSKKDTISLGEEFCAEISLLASNFRDSIFIYDDNDNLVFAGIDSLGYVKFKKKEMTKGSKLYKGFYKGSLIKDSKLPRFEIEYYVE